MYAVSSFYGPLVYYLCCIIKRDFQKKIKRERERERETERKRASKSDNHTQRERERQRERGGVSGVRTETETGRETERDTQRRKRRVLLPFFAVNVAPCIRVCSQLSVEHRLPRVKKKNSLPCLILA